MCRTIRDLRTPTHRTISTPIQRCDSDSPSLLACLRVRADEPNNVGEHRTSPLATLLLSWHLGLLIGHRCRPRRPTLQESKQATQEDYRQLSLSRETEAKKSLARSELICDKLSAGRSFNLEQTGASQLILHGLPCLATRSLADLEILYCTPAYRSRASSFVPKGPNLRNLPMGD